MNTRIETKKAIIIALSTISVVLALLFILSGVARSKRIQVEKMKAESLLSEKLQLDKTLQSMKTELNTLSAKNSGAERKILETSAKLAEKEAEIKKLLSEKYSARELKRKIAELEALKNQLDNEIAALSSREKRLLADNEGLNSKLLSAQQENQKLKNDNSILKAMVADNYRIDAVKGRNEKITSVARKTNKLIVSFDLPSDVDEKIFFKVVTPTGEEYSSKDNPAASSSIIEETVYFLASNEDTMLPVNIRRFEMIFKPSKKLQKGIYRFNIYNGTNYLGSTQLKLK